MEHSWSTSCRLGWFTWDGHCCLLYTWWSGWLKIYKSLIFRSQFNNIFWSLQGALVGTYKGRCHLYNTSGIISEILFTCIYTILMIAGPLIIVIIIIFSPFHSENKLQQKSQINLQNRKKRSNHKKITGFQVVNGLTAGLLDFRTSEGLIWKKK